MTEDIKMTENPVELTDEQVENAAGGTTFSTRCPKCATPINGIMGSYIKCPNCGTVISTSVKPFSR